MKKGIIVSLTFLFLSGCFSDNPEPLADQVYISVENVSRFNYQNTILNKIYFGSIDAGQKTDYIVADTVVMYRFAPAKLEIDHIEYVHIVLDVVGEEPLENGYYTFQIDASECEDESRLKVTFIQD